MNTNASYLVVDDSNAVRMRLIQMLHDFGIQNIVAACNGLDAIQAIKSQPIDCVICDFDMPIMNGLQLLYSIRTGQYKINRDLPFAMVTGYSNKELIDTALKLDVNTFILKPSDKQSLITHLNKIHSQMIAGTFHIHSIEYYKRFNIKSVVKSMHEHTEIRNNIKAGNQTIRPNTKNTDKVKATQTRPKDIPGSATYYDVDQVPIGSILAHDILDECGRKILAKGQKISLDLKSRIRYMGIKIQGLYVQ